MGVSGSGKSSVGALLATALGVGFVDGDSLHSEANIAKMSSGTPLVDEDRWPWLASVGRTLHAAEGTGLVLACSTLRVAYRRAILAEAPGTKFIHLNVDESTLRSRVDSRTHFMPASLLTSQLDSLEPLEWDEPGFAVAAHSGLAPEQVTEAIILRLSRR